MIFKNIIIIYFYLQYLPFDWFFVEYFFAVLSLKNLSFDQDKHQIDTILLQFYLQDHTKTLNLEILREDRLIYKQDVLYC